MSRRRGCPFLEEGTDLVARCTFVAARQLEAVADTMGTSLKAATGVALTVYDFGVVAN